MKKIVSPKMFDMLLVTTALSTLLIGLRIEWVLWLFDVVLCVAVHHFVTQYYQEPEVNIVRTKQVKPKVAPQKRQVKPRKKERPIQTAMLIHKPKTDEKGNPADTQKKGLLSRLKKTP